MENLKAILMALTQSKLINKTKYVEIEKEFANKDAGIEDYLIKNKIASEDEVYKAMASYYEMPFSKLDVLEINTSLVESFGLTFMQKHKIVPIRINERNVLIVATSEPFNIISVNAIASKFNGDVSFILVTPTDILNYLNSLHAVKNTANALVDLGEKKKNATEATENEDIEKITESINAPAVRLVDSIIREAIPFRASDIHIEPYEDKVCVRYRIDGDLITRIEFNKDNYPAVNARLKIISGMNIAERRIPQDGRINMDINGVEYDFRLSTLPTVNGEKFVIRVLDKSNFALTRAELGFRAEANDVIDKILSHPHGLVLLTGPTGCGKSTSLYCFLKEVNKPNVNIVTVEDPVEYTMLGINQIQVNQKADLTFATCLRSILRQDPDVIMIGEIRDEETAHMAVRAAITGHMVFSTLHTNNALGAVSRLKDMGVNSYLLADSLVGVISQRLIKKLCPLCKVKHKTTSEEMSLLKLTTQQEIYNPKGCKYCGFTGYKGRIAVHEIMYVNEDVRECITNNAPMEKLRAVARAGGLKDIFESGIMSVLDGQTSVSELLTLKTDN